MHRCSRLIGIGAAAALLSAVGCSNGKPAQGGSPTTSPPSSETTTSSSNAAPSSTVTLEALGSGEVYAIWIDPGGSAVSDRTTLPWSTTITVGPDQKWLGINVTGREGSVAGCRITVDNAVVNEVLPGSGEA